MQKNGRVMTNEPVTLTANAKKYLLDSCLSANKDGIKIQVKGGGSAGFSYDYNFLDEAIKPFDGVIDLSDDKKLVVDGMSLMYVIGTVLDYEQKLGSAALVFKNPNEASSCGCGKSFSV